MDTFLESGQEGEKLYYKCADLFHLCRIHLKQRHFLGEIMLSLTVA